MNGIEALINFLNESKDIYMVWNKAIIQNQEKELKQINELLEKSITKFITSQYSNKAYRARIIPANNYTETAYTHIKSYKIPECFSENTGINGFYADKMGAPPSNLITAGRANIEEQPCLYLASDIETACSEVQPCCNDIISVIEFSIESNLNLVDFRWLPESLQNFDSIKDNEDKLSEITFCNSMLSFFSIPVNSRDKDIYRYSQYISSYIMDKGIDGIIYKSSHNYNNNAYNIVLFAPQKATPSQEYGEAFVCLSVKSTFQSISKYYKNSNLKILTAERIEEPYLWNKVMLMNKNLSEKIPEKSQSKE